MEYSEKVTHSLVCSTDGQCDSMREACCGGAGAACECAAVSHVCDGHLCEHI